MTKKKKIFLIVLLSVGGVTSKNIDVQTFETINYDFKNTDHNPVVMTFKLG